MEASDSSEDYLNLINHYGKSFAWERTQTWMNDMLNTYYIIYSMLGINLKVWIYHWKVLLKQLNILYNDNQIQFGDFSVKLTPEMWI